MSLYRQLIVFTLALFLALLTGTWLVTLDSTRSFLINQLESHAQDTATSLGIAISQYAAQNDTASMESMINATFDRGYYQTIKFVSIEGKVLIERSLDVTVEDVPAWFIASTPSLVAPEANANVMQGWRQMGVIFVKSHAGYAYNALWQNSIRMTLLFLICGVFVLLIGGFGLHFLLRPLKLVQHQADAICRKEYETQEHLPLTKELRQVVIAMNRMTEKVKEMIREETHVAEEFRQHAYQDPLTGLGNRRYFETQLRAWHEQQDVISGGMLFLVQLHDLQQLNQRKGLQSGDELLKSAAVILQNQLQSYPHFVLARLTGGDFGIFVPNMPSDSAKQIAADLSSALSQSPMRNISDSDNIASIGAATCDTPAPLHALLAEADWALRSARQAGPNAWHVRAITEETEHLPESEQDWKTILEDALKAKSIRLMVQPVSKAANQKEILHLEIFSKLVRKDGKEFRAEIFLPFAERLGLLPLLDRIVLENVFRLNRVQLGVDAVAVNLSVMSLNDRPFRQWLDESMNSLSPSVPRLIFEFAEFGAIRNLDTVREFRNAIVQQGHAISLDHYGQSLSKLGYLRSLWPEFVKVDRGYTEELKDAANDSRFYFSSLCNVAHSIDIQVIAEGVETQDQHQRIRELNIDGVQGYLIDRPKTIEEYLSGR